MTFEELFKQNFRRVYNAVYMRVLHRETAEDITSETFLKAWRSFDSYDPACALPSTWLLAIAGNEVKMHFRRASTTNEIPADVLPEGQTGESEDDWVRTISINREARRLLSGLGEKERELVSLRLGAQLTFREMGTLMQITEKAAEERYRRVIAKLKRSMAGKTMEDFG